MKQIFLSISHTMACLLFAGTIMLSSAVAQSNNVAQESHTVQKIALLPFVVNGQGNQDHISKGVVQMLFSRLDWPGHVQVVSGEKIRNILSTGICEGKTQLFTANKISVKTDSRFVLSGSITRLGNAFSVDAKLFDMEKKRYMPFFVQSDNADDFIDKIDKMAAMINQQAFSRKTMTWDAMYKEKKESVDENRRRNPEYLMQNPAWQKTKDSGRWKFWKRLF